MISDTFIFVFGTIVFGTWLIGSYIEFKKMDKSPENYQKHANTDLLSEIEPPKKSKKS